MENIGPRFKDYIIKPLSDIIINMLKIVKSFLAKYI